MNTNEPSENFDRDFDERVAALLRNSDIASPDLQRRTRQRISARLFQRRITRATAVVGLFLGVATVWRFWLAPIPVPAVAELSAAELNSLFAPPPVDPLAVLDRQQQVAVKTLDRLEAPQ